MKRDIDSFDPDQKRAIRTILARQENWSARVKNYAVNTTLEVGHNSEGMRCSATAWALNEFRKGFWDGDSLENCLQRAHDHYVQEITRWNENHKNDYYLHLWAPGICKNTIDELWWAYRLLQHAGFN